MVSRRVVIGIPNLNVFGGTEAQTLNLGKWLLSKGYVPLVCCYFCWSERVVADFHAAKVDVVCLELARGKPVVLVRELMRFFRGVKPDIVHIQYLSPGLLPILAARLSGVRRLFGTVHQLGNPYGFRAKLMIRIAGRLCAGFVCVSKAVEESWFGDASIFDRAAFTKGRKHFTIHNGVDVAHLQQMAKLVDPEALRKTLALNDEPIVGIVARLTAEKGHDLLLQAMQIVISNVSRAMLIVVGDGPDRQRLVNRANDLGLSGRVRWLGEMDPARVYGIYKLMDVVVVPSVYEGFGFAAVEAMAVGRPVVATHTGGLAEIIEDGVTGYLVTPRAPKEFAQKIIALLGAPQMGVAMGKAGQERVQRHFALDKFGESLLKAYQATLNA